MATYIGLYYPFIHFKDDSWLKLTALYWDRLCRIVPEGYKTTRDTDTVKELADELGFIENVVPGDEAISLGEKFVSLLHQHKDQMNDRYNVFKRHEWPDDPITVAAAPPGSDGKLAYVFYEKMWPELQDALVSTSLALPDRNGDPRWVGMHPKLAFVYMASLAEEIAGYRGYHPVTDETKDHIAVSGCTLERLAQALLEDVNIVDLKPTEQEIEELMMRIAVQAVIPENIAHVPTENIVKIRKQYSGDLANFQDYIHRLATDLGKQDIKDRKHLDQHIKIVLEKNLKPRLKELRSLLMSAGISTVLGALCISTSLPLAALGAPLLGLETAVPQVVASVSVAVGLCRVFSDHKKAIRGAMQSPAAYLLRLEKDLPPNKLANWVVSDTRKFFFGV